MYTVALMIMLISNSSLLQIRRKIPKALFTPDCSFALHYCKHVRTFSNIYCGSQ